MKAQLIGNGFLIHKINKIKGCEAITLKQQKEPISTRDLHDVLPFKVDTANCIYHQALSNQTLPIGLLLTREEYQKVINLPEHFRKMVKELSEKRNELHFMSVLEFEISLSYLGELQLINDFVDKIFTNVQNNS